MIALSYNKIMIDDIIRRTSVYHTIWDTYTPQQITKQSRNYSHSRFIFWYMVLSLSKLHLFVQKKIH